MQAIISRSAAKLAEIAAKAFAEEVEGCGRTLKQGKNKAAVAVAAAVIETATATAAAAFRFESYFL